MNTDNWIALDWGTSHLRAWLMNSSGEVLDQRSCDQGMNSLNSDQFEGVLLEQIDYWLNADSCTQVLACGMLGSRQGWVEASYDSVPCSPGTVLTKAPVSDPRINVHICPGIKQLAPADVMRGEETQVAGLLTDAADFSGVVCLPGTHCKWVRVVEGKITEFQTFLTGELYSLLAKQSVLRHSLDTSAWDEQAFKVAIDDSMARPQSITAQLFALRAETLIGDLSAAGANARLSGLLIGLELASSKDFWAGQQVTIIGESQLSRHYSQALQMLSVTSTQANSETMTLKGLSLAYRQLNGA
ncbi:MAG: 2-dehydro-3-deoxygalactonokinase [Pseudomonadales bacterium]|nr:2-dehydro-3-deoxygalactonokinase [Pseudomonadales bacterium]NRA16937.1 2-dehydro-3-deoxygalactonokinase [Oceanospirillaceae bacterium]